MKDNYIILSEKKWNNSMVNSLEERTSTNWYHIQNKKDFCLEILDNIKPNKIFIPHWSHIIPKDIYSKYECIVFHMTDLPFGRGGSPLQNLITRNFKETKISAIKVCETLDGGDIYLKRPLELNGTAEEIYSRASDIILEMIIEILETGPLPTKQVGEVVHFKRRTPEMSRILNIKNLNTLHDHIRMLDADGYPKAFLDNEFFKFEFSKSKINSDSIEAYVRITKK